MRTAIISLLAAGLATSAAAVNRMVGLPDGSFTTPMSRQ